MQHPSSSSAVEEEEVLKRITAFEGKRNAAFTLLFAGDTTVKEMGKLLDGIERKLKEMKHKEKAGQLLRVLKAAREAVELRDKAAGANGWIVCCGLSKTGDMVLEKMEPKTKIAVFEYFYDYCFHVQRIREIHFGDVVILVQDEKDVEALIAEISKLALAASPLLLIGDVEVRRVLREEQGAVGLVLLFDDAEFDEELLSLVRQSGAIINKIKGTKGTEFAEKWGKIHAQRRYEGKFK